MIRPELIQSSEERKAGESESSFGGEPESGCSFDMRKFAFDVERSLGLNEEQMNEVSSSYLPPISPKSKNNLN